MEKYDNTLDLILVQLGRYGKYQCFLIALFSLAIGIHASARISFVFSAKDLTYRCLIPECDTSSSIFNPTWLKNAVPFPDNDKHPAPCERYGYVNVTNTTCNSNKFDVTIREECSSFIYKTREKSIVNDFSNLHCSENLWKLTLVGTINSVGQCIGLPISGYISDKYGRKTLLIWGMTLCGIAGIIKSCATSYLYFVILEFLDAALGAGAYSCAFILGVELVGPKERVLAGSLICSTYALGSIFTGVVAWVFFSWRPFILTVYSLNLLLPLYYWLTPESLRWLLSNKKIEETKKILQKAAKINGTTIAENTLAKLSSYNDNNNKSVRYSMMEYFSDSILIMRFINICFCWITCMFLFYGFTIISIGLVGNSYFDFILTEFIEIPAYFVTWLMVDRLGRRIYLNVSFLLTCAACVSFIFLPSHLHWLKLIVYLLGKFGATAATNTCYILSSEIFPTHLRNTLMAISSMFGRIGAMVAPQMPLLEQIWKPFPLVLFAGMSTIASLLCLLFPETTNIKLPDTIKEAEAAGKTISESKF